MIVEKRTIPITDTPATNDEVIMEVARDSWPKLIPSETRVYAKEDGRVIYHGEVDERWYDEDDMQMMRDSNTVTVVCE